MRRFALRDLRSDEGLGLVETVAALLVFGLIMSGLAASMAAFAHSTTLSRARATATSLAQQYTEKARAVGAAQLETCNNQTPMPPSSAPFHGDAGHSVVTGADSYCIPYQKPVTQDGMNFTLTRLVLIRATANDVTGQPQSEKYLVVQVSWTDGGGAVKTYELDTIFNQKGAITAAPAQGIRVVIKDASGNIITADSANWAVSITGSSCPSNLCTDPTATTSEGTYSQVDMATGNNYTCTATQTSDSSSTYQAGSNPGLTVTTDPNTGLISISGNCGQVNTGSVTDFVTTWTSGSDCATSSSTGTYNFTVVDASSGAGLANMTVTMTQVNDGTQFVSNKTNASGVLNGLKPKANWYTYTVTDPTLKYVAQSNSYGPVCVAAGVTVQAPPVKMTLNTCVTTGSQATVNFTVTGSDTQQGLNTYKPSLLNASTFTSTAFNATSTVGGVAGYSTKNNVTPGSYYYMVGLPNTSTYQGSGLIGPICIAPGETRNLAVALNPAGSCARHTGQNAYVTLNVKDPTGAPVNGATIELVNVNGDGNYSVNTDANGNPNQNNGIGGVTYKSIKVTDVGPYQYVVLAPNGNFVTSDIQGPVCTTQNALTTAPNLTLQGLVSVSVTVRNNDTVPMKTYTIALIDSNGNVVQSLVVTVPNCQSGAGCTRNPSAPVTFTKVQTGAYYITVRSQITSNDNLVDTAPTQSPGSTTYYTFTAPGGSYTSASTGFGDLATTDDSGGA